MFSRVATRSTRVILAVASTVALGAGLTACGDDLAAAGGAATPAASTPAASTPAASTPEASASAASTPAASTPGGSGGSSGTGGDSGKKDGVGQSCGTNDLKFTIGKGDDSGYLYISAKAQSGITCYLKSSAPLVLFSSAEKTNAYPADLMTKPAPDSIELSGDTLAWAVLIPNTTRAEGAPEFSEVDLTLGAGDSNTVHVGLPGSYMVDASAVTSWYANDADATPDAN